VLFCVKLNRAELYIKYCVRLNICLKVSAGGLLYVSLFIWTAYVPADEDLFYLMGPKE
jgi:hypothetical protein